MKFDNKVKANNINEDPVVDILKEAADKVGEVTKDATPTTVPVEKPNKVITYIVIAEKLNVRETPNGKVLKIVSSGDILKGAEPKDGWVKLENNAGYVMEEFIAPKKG